MSYKNRIQEFLQKRSLPLPHYNTLQTSGSSHDPLWTSTLTLYDQTQIKGSSALTKKKAEEDVAHKGFLFLWDRINSQPKVKIDSSTVLLVDVENVPNFISELLEKFEGLSIYAFVGINHPLASRDYPDSVVKIISPSDRTDGTDTCIQVYTGIFLSEKKYRQYLIATRDHFGSALVDIIKFVDPTISAKVVSHINQI